ncbi:immunoglobulin-binding protein 1 [Fopius arisanus]|uniref:Immunoglobulin-binding protein 1 n=1 Tax=Fopius arisanus TaxID=64838 RepID=A0A9R1T9C8_9HYME|nr:PREDICTED: immunoglobulin-binding protein 1 [Fopius arisanus]
METSENKSSENDTNLSSLFDTALELFNSLEKTDEATNTPEVQVQVKRCMKMLEDATNLVSMADMFSANEDFDEIPTENVKYFLLPALLGSLSTKLCDRAHRLHYVNVSEVYFYDFLERVKAYGITDVEIPKRKNPEETAAAGETSSGPPPSNTKMIEDMVNTRGGKLKRFRDQKELQEQLEILKKSMDNPNLDDETIRKYFVTLIKSYVMKAIDEINSLSQEKEILAFMEKRKDEGEEPRKKDYHPPKLRPIIITKNDVQKKVFGAGYPSLPVMTVEEFYEKKIADGEWSAAGAGASAKSLQDMANNQNSSQDTPEDLEKEAKVERDDEEFLQQQRAMDEYKDTHKRGWGNRHNRS